MQDPRFHLCSCAFAVLALSAASGFAQDLVAPAECANVDGTSSGPFAGVTHRGREQVLIGPSRLVPMRAKTLDAIWFRRDASRLDTLTGGVATIQLRVSETSVAPERMSPLFQANHGTSPVLVFAGSISVPSSPVPGTDLWAADQTLRIPFSVPFLYGSNGLCLEIETTSAEGASPKWPIDCASEALAGSITVLGAHCSGAPDLGGARMLYANSETLVIGATTRISAAGRFGTYAALMLGSEIPGGIDLSALGMNGCTWYVQPVATIMASLSARPAIVPAWGIAFTSLQLQIPFDTALLGGSVLAQAANVEIGGQYSNLLGVTLSEGLRLTIAPATPTLGMAMVESPHADSPAPLPTQGVVVNNRAPVLKLLYH